MRSSSAWPLRAGLDVTALANWFAATSDAAALQQLCECVRLSGAAASPPRVLDLGGSHDPRRASARFVDGEGSSDPGGHFSAPVIFLGRPKVANTSWSWKTVLRLMPDSVTVKTWRVFRAYPPSWARV